MPDGSDLFDFAIGDCSGDDLRRICQEAIARGEAAERAARAARKRLLQRLLLAVLAVVLCVASAVALSVGR